jgi:hypothetical protein
VPARRKNDKTVAFLTAAQEIGAKSFPASVLFPLQAGMETAYDKFEGLSIVVE